MLTRSKSTEHRRFLADYAARRAVRSFLLLLSVSVVCFVLSEIAPGDFFGEARLNPQLSSSALAGLRAQHALDQPLFLKYSYWLGSVFQGDWGYSFAYNRPAGTLLWGRAANTLLLTITANFAAWLIAIPVALWGAGARSRLVTVAVEGFTSLLLALPDLVIVLLLLFTAARTGALPLGGITSAGYSQFGGWNKITDRLAHLILPATALTLSMLPPIMEHARSSVAEVFGSAFIKAAEAQGIPRHRILFRHALPAAANALISLLGLSVGTLLSASLLVEAAFGWPGLGQLLLQAILERDIYVVIDAVMLSAGFLVAGTLLSDLLQRAVDPRIRLE